MKRSREPQDDINPASPDSPEADVPPSGPQHTAKYTELDLDATASDTDRSKPLSSAVHMLCSLPPHADMTFDSYTAYEAHYSSFHTNRCLQCRKNFPSQHLLGVHIEEMHDPIVRVRRDQGVHTFSCFVEGCDRKCMTPQKRRMHLIDKHMYPKNFFFAVTRDGIDGRRSLLVDGAPRRRRSSATSQTKGARGRAATLEGQASDAGEQVSESSADKGRASQTPTVDDDVDTITSSMASLRFVPAAVQFGNRNRSGFAKR
ncbi:Zinc finger protein 511 [Beauveria bassiana]|uniref:Zinc finger protein 511 n=1 Tax=Beauveria bassiana TaxID=176275 RepID=A0A2N6NRW5_BEABA|nr:Zinc finger protein 511 [Beauveria bassiana]